MPQWNRTIHLKAARAEYSATSDWPKYRDAIVKAIEESGWLADTDFENLRDHVNSLKQCISVDAGEIYWSAIYDVADEDRVWIETS